MTRRQLALLAIRLLALWFAVRCAFSVTSLLGILLPPREGADIPSTLIGMGAISLALTAGWSVFLFWAAPRLARFLSDDEMSGAPEDRLAIGAIALRVVGLLFVDEALGHALGIFAGLAGGDPHGITAANVLAGVLVGGLAATLILGAAPIARRLFGSAASDDQPITTTLQAVAFSIVGLAIAVSAGLHLVEGLGPRSESASLFGLSYAADGDREFRSSWPDVMNGVRLLLGAGLCLGSARLALAWHRPNPRSKSATPADSNEPHAP